MSFDILVKNFQSIAKAKVTVDGFTAITGPNNSGKSALVRAFIGVWKNTPGTFFVRRGARKSSVTIRFEEGTEVTWEKGKGVNRYELDGKPFEFVGREVPQDVSDLGIRSIKAADKELWPQIAPPISSLFLFGQGVSGAVVAEAIADVERVGKLNAALSLCEKDKRESASRLKVRQKDLEKFQEELKKYEGLEEVRTRVEEIQTQHRRLLRIEKVLRDVREKQRQIRLLTEELQKLEGVEGIEVPSEEVSEALSEQSRLLRTVNGLHQSQVGAKRDLEHLREGACVALPGLTEIDGLEEVLGELEALKGLLSKKNRIETMLSSLSVLDDLQVVDEGEIDRLVRIRDAVRGIRSSEEQVERAKKEVSSCDGEMSRVQGELERVAARLVELWGEVEKCPTCGTEHGGIDDPSCLA